LNEEIPVLVPINSEVATNVFPGSEEKPEIGTIPSIFASSTNREHEVNRILEDTSERLKEEDKASHSVVGTTGKIKAAKVGTAPPKK
jgi:hypothetical protein